LRLLNIEANHRLALYRSHFNPDQPRVPAGHPDGGQWTRVRGYEGTGAASNTQQTPSSRSSMTDELAGPIRSGAQYAQAKTKILTDHPPLPGIARINKTTKALAETLARAVDIVDYLPTFTPATIWNVGSCSVCEHGAPPTTAGNRIRGCRDDSRPGAGGALRLEGQHQNGCHVAK